VTPAALRALLLRSRRGDGSAFEAVVVATRDRLFATARRLLGREALAEEVLQEAYVALWSQGGAVPDSPEAWLRTAVVNRALDQLRREETRRATAWDVAEPAAMAAGADPAEQAGAAEVSEAVGEALDAVPPGERAVFALRAFEGWSFDEIAVRMGTRASTVRNQYMSARRRLEAALRKKGVTP